MISIFPPMIHCKKSSKMNTLLPEQILKNQMKMIEELAKGKESAAQLRILLQQPFENDESVSVDELTVKILRSFTETLSMLSFPGSDHEAFQHQPSDGTHRSPKISDENRIKQLGPTERRGRDKRRNATVTRIEVSPTIQDGHAWRKYGQKDILNSEHPRCYFRCTHKYDEDCKATKQVQKIKHDSPLYQITYFGHHTCKDTLRAPQIISEIDPIDTCLLSFQSKMPTISNPEIGAHRHEEVVSSESLNHLDHVVDFAGLHDLGNENYFEDDVILQGFH